MGYLGDKGRSEVMRFWLTLDTAPTGTPTITITRGQGTALDTPISTANMTQGASTLEWYYDYTTEAAAQVGMYTAKYIAVVDGVTRYAYDQYDVTVNDADDLATDIAAVPTAGEIDTELTSTHGSGAWTTGSTGAGARSIIFHVKDSVPNDIIGARVTVHNSSNDDLPDLGQGTTDANGNTPTILIDDGTYKVRVSKAGEITSAVLDATVSASATIELVVTTQTVTNPTDPDVCRLRIYPITLGNADITGLADNLTISSLEALTKVEGQFISNTSSTFTYDSSTDPDSYYFDAVRGSVVYIKCDILGIDTDAGITVPDLSTKDLSDLIS